MNVRFGFFSLHPSFKAHDGMSDGPGGLICIEINQSFLTLNFTNKVLEKVLFVMFS